MEDFDSWWKTCLEDEELEYDLLFVTVSCLYDWLELELDFAMAIAEEDLDLQTACLPMGTAALDFDLPSFGASLGLLWNSTGGGTGDRGGENVETAVEFDWAVIRYQLNFENVKCNLDIGAG